MYFNQARESIEQNKDYAHDQGYRDIISQARQRMDAAQRFHLGDFKNFKENKLLPMDEPFTGEWVEDIKLPYSCLWIDFQDSTFPAMPKGGAIVADLPEIGLVSVCPLFEFKGVWVPPLACVEIKYDQSIATFDYEGIKLGKMEFFGLEFLREYLHLNDSSQFGPYMVFREIAMLSAFLKIMSCKNIETEIVQPSGKLNKSRQKKGKKPFLSYKVLTIKAPGQRRAGSVPTGTGTAQRVHLCRGHFKTFTAEKPLLGKHTGTYWWQPMVRGKNKKGTVVKDYNVKLAE